MWDNSVHGESWVLCECSVGPYWPKKIADKPSFVPPSMLADRIRRLHKGPSRDKRPQSLEHTTGRQCRIFLLLSTIKRHPNNPLLRWQRRWRIATSNPLHQDNPKNKRQHTRFSTANQSQVLPIVSLLQFLGFGADGQ